MRLATATALLLLASTTVAPAADHPNLTGDWAIDVSKSKFGPYPAPTSHVLKIVHADPSLTIIEEQQGGFGEPSSTRTYFTDGRQTTFSSMGANITSVAMWKDDALIFNATGIASSPAGEASFDYTTKWTLSDGGNTLTHTVAVHSPQGTFEMTYVFEKR